MRILSAAVFMTTIAVTVAAIASPSAAVVIFLGAPIIRAAVDMAPGIAGLFP